MEISSSNSPRAPSAARLYRNGGVGRWDPGGPREYGQFDNPAYCSQLEILSKSVVFEKGLHGGVSIPCYCHDHSWPHYGSPPRSATATLGLPTPGRAGSFFDWCGTHALELKTVRPLHVATWIEDFCLGPNRPLSKNSLRCVCCTIFWSFGISHHRIQHIPFAVQSTWSKKAKRPSGAEKTPKRSWIRSPRFRPTALTRIDPYSLRKTEPLCRGIGRRFFFWSV